VENLCFTGVPIISELWEEFSVMLSFHGVAELLLTIPAWLADLLRGNNTICSRSNSLNHI
jgi:hypothetical protein